MLLGSSPIASPRLLHKHARSEDPSLHRHYPASAVLRSSPTPVWSAMLATALGPTRSDRPPLITRIALPACCDHYPGGPERVRCPVSFPVPRGLPRYPVGSASTSLLSRPAQTSLTLRPAGSLGRPRRPLSQGSSLLGHPNKPLVSYSIKPVTIEVASSSTGNTRLQGALGKIARCEA